MAIPTLTAGFWLLCPGGRGIEGALVPQFDAPGVLPRRGFFVDHGLTPRRRRQTVGFCAIYAANELRGADFQPRSDGRALERVLHLRRTPAFSAASREAVDDAARIVRSWARKSGSSGRPWPATVATRSRRVPKQLRGRSCCAAVSRRRIHRGPKFRRPRSGQAYCRPVHRR
jgi:hypothetical protein